MRIKHRYAVKADDLSKREIIDFIEKNKIKHRITSGMPILVFEIYEDDKRWENIEKLTKKYNENPLSECVYTKEELDNAAWLRVRSKRRWEYPQPENEYKSITYDNSSYCYQCGCGLIQKSNFKIKKSPNWGTNNFLMLNWIHDELFANDKAAEILEKSKLKGFKLLDVLYAKRNSPVDNIKQIFVNEILKPGMILQKEDINKEINCPECGCTKFVLYPRGIKYHENVFKGVNVDIVKSSEVFGWGHAGSREIYISNNFYRLITDKMLGKNLVFEPINLII